MLYYLLCFFLMQLNQCYEKIFKSEAPLWKLTHREVNSLQCSAYLFMARSTSPEPEAPKSTSRTLLL